MSLIDAFALWIGRFFLLFWAVIGIAFPISEAIYHFQRFRALRRGTPARPSRPQPVTSPEHPHLYDQDRRFEVVR